MQKAVFLDRDGVINSDVGHYYIYKTEDFVINKDIFISLKMLSENGFKLFIITNQGGVAKGIYSLQDVNKVHGYLLKQLAAENIHIEQIYVCPHHESVVKCECRKPSPYMINSAIEKYNINRKLSFMIGDSDRDILSAQAAGITGIKIPKNTSIKDICINIINGKV